MKKTLLTSPFRSRGSSSDSWELHIPSRIVRQYGINETTNFLIEYGDYGITLFYAKIERKIGSTDLGIDNFGQSIPSIAQGEN